MSCYDRVHPAPTHHKPLKNVHTTNHQSPITATASVVARYFARRPKKPKDRMIEGTQAVPRAADDRGKPYLCHKMTLKHHCGAA